MGEPYTVTVSPEAGKTLEGLGREERQEIERQLAQVAELASIAPRRSIDGIRRNDALRMLVRARVVHYLVSDETRTVIVTALK